MMDINVEDMTPEQKMVHEITHSNMLFSIDLTVQEAMLLRSGLLRAIDFDMEMQLQRPDLYPEFEAEIVLEKELIRRLADRISIFFPEDEVMEFLLRGVDIEPTPPDQRNSDLDE